MYINLFDSHIHSDDSPDGNDMVTSLCSAAISMGISGISITDHCEMDQFEELKFGKRIAHSCFATHKAQDVFERQLIVTSGIELGQPLANPERAADVLYKGQFDFVLGSLHTIKNYGSMHKLDYSTVDIDMVFRQYYTELLELVKWNGFDSLAHLGYPLRYLRNYGLSVELSQFDDLFSEILRTLAQNGKALELNSGGLRQKVSAFTPSNKYLQMFRSYGGELITLGSDAHRHQDIGHCLQDGMELLKEVGFKYFTFYKERKPIMLRLL